MEFHEKLQELRKQKGLTQDELAAQLYVSRTAISKWETGRGYPSIDSLKTIADFFSVTVDELLSTNEILTIAEEGEKRKVAYFRDLIFGLLDLCMALLLFLPFFAHTEGEEIHSVSLLALCDVQPYLKGTYFAVVALTILMGILLLTLQNWQHRLWMKGKLTLSLALGGVCVLTFIVSSQPYASIYAFVLLGIKAFTLLKHE